MVVFENVKAWPTGYNKIGDHKAAAVQPTSTKPLGSAAVYDSILNAAGNNSSKIQTLCEKQRNKRNEKFRVKLLDAEFEGVKPDDVLYNTINNPDYIDPRNNLCVWTRPTEAVQRMVAYCQEELKELSPSIWLMPPTSLHMTVLEIVHSTTPENLEFIVSRLNNAFYEMSKFHLDHNTRLVRPKLSFDDAAVALSFVPAAGEFSSHSPPGRLKGQTHSDDYTYIHMRRDLIQLCDKHGVQVAARYATTSCHLTLARFVTTADHGIDGRPSQAKMKAWVAKIDELNRRLEQLYWPRDGKLPEVGAAAEWFIGAEKGLDIRRGRLWYGGGKSVIVGPAF